MFLNLEVNDSSKKKATFLETYFGVGKSYDAKQKGNKNESDGDDTIPPQQYNFSTNFLNGEEFTAVSRNDTIEGESCAIHLVEISRSSIGAGESSKLLVQHKHFVLL